MRGGKHLAALQAFSKDNAELGNRLVLDRKKHRLVCVKMSPWLPPKTSQIIAVSCSPVLESPSPNACLVDGRFTLKVAP